MDPNFIIHVDRLRKNGKTLSIEAEVSSDFLDLPEEELHFLPDVHLSGEAYLAEEKLVLHLDAEASAVMACSVCNGETSIDIRVCNFYHVEELKNVKGACYDFSKVLREEILLAVPRFVECNNGNCPERALMTSYLSGKTKTS